MANEASVLKQHDSTFSKHIQCMIYKVKHLGKKHITWAEEIIHTRHENTLKLLFWFYQRVIYSVGSSVLCSSNKINWQIFVMFLTTEGRLKSREEENTSSGPRDNNDIEG